MASAATIRCSMVGAVAVAVAVARAFIAVVAGGVLLI